MNKTLSDGLTIFRQERLSSLTITLLANALWKDRSVLCTYYGHNLIDGKFEKLCYDPLQYPYGEVNPLQSVLHMIMEISLLPHLPSIVDIGELMGTMLMEQPICRDTLVSKMWSLQEIEELRPKDVVLYGFGRIGRILVRELCTDPVLGLKLRLRAVVTRDKKDINLLKKRASLLKKDSVHGLFEGKVSVDEASHSLIINGVQVQFVQGMQAEDVNYAKLGIHNGLLIDNTGKGRNRADLEKHLVNKGIDTVIVTAPADDIPNVVYGVNHEEIHHVVDSIYSTASCTTNAIAPVLDVLDRAFGIENGHIETIHAYTNDQNLVDNMHAKSRRGRAANLNMVITETGAGSAIAKILPQFVGKLTSNAIRVPVANGSLAILMLKMSQSVTVNQVHELLGQSCLRPKRFKQIQMSYEEDLVSSDIIGNRSSGIVDTCATSIGHDGKSLTLYIWYDNEYGYSMQVLGFATWLAQQKHVESSCELAPDATAMVEIDY